MSFRDYGDDSLGDYTSEEEYEKKVKEEIKDIKKKYGKEKAEEFRIQEEKARKSHLENITKAKEEVGELFSGHIWARLYYNIFKGSVYMRAALHTEDWDKIIKNRKS